MILPKTQFLNTNKKNMTTTYKLTGTDENGNVILVSNSNGIVSEKNSTFEPCIGHQQLFLVDSSQVR